MGERRSQDTALAVSRDTVCTAVCVGGVSSGAWAERPAGCLREASLEEVMPGDQSRVQLSTGSAGRCQSASGTVFKGLSGEAR